MIQLEIIRGRAGAWRLRGGSRRDGSAPTGFTSADTLTAGVWIGDGRPVLLTPTAEWLDPSTCYFTTSVDAEQSAQLEPGVYTLQVDALVGDTPVAIARALLAVSAAPYVAQDDIPEGEDDPAAPAPLKAYCTPEDLEDLYPLVGTLQDSRTGLTGFARQRQAARDWLDGLILAAYRCNSGMSPTLEGVRTWASSSVEPDPRLSRLLEADGLVLTGADGRKAVEACACYALSRILGGQLDSQFAGHAARFRTRARSLASSLLCGIDSNCDGKADEYVWLGNVNMLRG